MTVSRLHIATSTGAARAGATPAGGVLGHGVAHTLVTADGTGCSWHGEHALTRWGRDAVEGCDGLFFYLRDTADGQWWSATRQPALPGSALARMESRIGAIAFDTEHHGLRSRLEITVAHDVPVELRRLTLTNLGTTARRIEITTYAEVVLHHPAADASHPAFSKLFIQTEADGAHGTLLARRRPRGHDESHPWLVHALHGPGEAQWETDRVRFIGRGRSVHEPRALTEAATLSGTTGDVLDPIVSVRRIVEVPAGGSVSVVSVLAAAPTRGSALALSARFSNPESVDAAFVGATEAEHARLEVLGLTPVRSAMLQALAVAVQSGSPLLRADAAVLERAGDASAVRERIGIRPGRPLVIVRADLVGGLQHLEDAITTHRYWSALGLPVSTLVLCDDPDRLPASVVLHGETDALHVLAVNSTSAAELDSLLADAALIVTGPLPELLAETSAPQSAAVVPRTNGQTVVGAREPLQCANGFGGFSADGREYVIELERDAQGRLHWPPLPWSNVMANESFGTLVTESGASCTWSRNSREHRLTPWLNDPLTDPHAEALYVRDDATGALWSPLPGPSMSAAFHEVRHGFGSTIFRSTYAGLNHETTIFVARAERLKLARITITNTGSEARRLTLAAYQRLVLGVTPEDDGRRIVTTADPGAAVLFATNAAAREFADGVAFAAAVSDGAIASRSLTTDRARFIGAGGRVGEPAALLASAPLDGRTGGGLDACFAQAVSVTLAPGERREITFLLGEASSHDDARSCVARMSAPGAVAAALAEVRAFWDEIVSGVRIETPSPALDLMVNGWLAYQTLSCRIWGRTAFSQSGGAFGFRDQLQDAASLMHTRPGLTRAQLLLNAAHQFEEGDVMHWWHPPLSKGIRTRFADDLLWLPYLATTYLTATGDRSVLDERASFVAARALEPGEDEVFLKPSRLTKDADLYTHCVLALDRSLATGAHGLPLFGTGDWNDGMNRVGREGRGESVWMGFFLVTILAAFAPVCESRGDHARAATYRAHREGLLVALNDAGWDGEWYRRAYYDDGTPLGTHSGTECRIDGLAQAWSVISGVAPADRAAQAMDMVEKHLIRDGENLIRLLTPAFRDTPNDPGYIKGYVAGVRENGGQYTHAALWVVRAMAELGRRDRAAALLEMLSPVSHTRTRADVERYQAEPYVIAADVYGEAPHVGRGGWTWYTGSAGWMLRVAIESVLGVTPVNGDHLRIKPVIPDAWPGYQMWYRVPGTTQRIAIVVRNPEACSETVLRATFDGAPLAVEGGAVLAPMPNDGRDHQVEIVLGAGT
jgi:cyclic beta-1,2-glucan synthetase